jgi:hypothetical protein
MVCFKLYDQADGPAIHIHGGSTNIYVHNVEAYKKKYGLQDKDDDFDNCDSSINYPNGVQKGHVIVYNWFHYLESQGMYIGNTAPNNQYTHIAQRAVLAEPFMENLEGLVITQSSTMRLIPPEGQIFRYHFPKKG